MKSKQLPITHVAIRLRDKVWSLPAPNRHADVIRVIVESDPSTPIGEIPMDNQGFLDTDGRFLNRRQALYNAEVNKQLKPNVKIKLGMLFSEDIW
jgi:hypothetical protein